MRKNKVGSNHTEGATATRVIRDPVICSVCNTNVERHAAVDAGDRWFCRHSRACDANKREHRLSIG